MSKKKFRGVRNIPISDYRSEKKITEINIGEYNKAGMHIYGINVQLARAIPNIVDGLKPVARRCLYASVKLAKADKTFKKVLAINGQIIQIHPHGDSSSENTLKSMSKPWEYAYPLIDIDGNNGTPKGDEAAAGRYLDAQVSKYAMDCYFKDWDESLIDMVPSYNPEFDEPVSLISVYPDLLLRPSDGFTFGIASKIPAYNLVEAFNAVIELMKNPQYEPVLIPDMPSGCIVVDDGSFPEICRTGLGTFIMRSEIEVDEQKNMLTVYSLPFQANLDDIKIKITNMRTTDFPTLVDMFDGSNSYGVYLEIKFSPGTDLEAMKQLLYKKTKLQDVFGVKMRYVDMQQGKVILYNLKQVMETWIENRRIIKRRFIINRLVEAKQRYHIVEILIEICEDAKFLEQVIKLIRSASTEELLELLHNKFGDRLSTVQAMGIADMRLKDLTATARAKYRAERIELKDKIKELESMINSHKKIDAIIIDELEKGIKKYGQPRRSRIEKYVDPEKAVRVDDTEYILIFTKNGMVKKLPVNSKDVGEFNRGDEPIKSIRIKNNESVVVFDQAGYIHKIAVSDIAMAGKSGRGVSVSQYARIGGEIVSIYPFDFGNSTQFVFVTKKGLIKKTPASEYSLRRSMVAISIKKDDELVYVCTVKNDSDAIIYTKRGYANRFHTEDVPSSGRVAYGVIGIDLLDNDEVVGVAEVASNDTHIMVMTEKGNGKVCSLSTFEQSKRRAGTLTIASVLPSDAILTVIPCDKKDKFFIALKADTRVLSFSEFQELTRNHYCAKIVPVKRGEKILHCSRIS